MNPLNILTLDGGGIRGLYTASVLETLAQRFAQKRGVGKLDIGSGFDLILGTSTGAILASGLAYGMPISRIKQFYCERGKEVFPDPMPDTGWKLLRWCCRHRRKPGSDGLALKSALQDIFGNATFRELFTKRGIGLCITATDLHQHHPRIFKSGHLGGNYLRDDNLRIVDACLASAAAPIYLPLASSNGNSGGECRVYADGGLWANNPVVLGLTEALAIAEKDQPIRILSIGTCPAPSGEVPDDLQRGLLDWKAGASALELSMNAQASAASYQAEKLIEQLHRQGMNIELYRCAETPPSKEMAKCIGLDRTDDKATKALIRHGAEDGTHAFKQVQSDTDHGDLLEAIFSRMEPISETEKQHK